MDSARLKDVSFTYRGGSRPALSRVDFVARPGERVAVIGLAGAGKSTLLRCLNRLVPASYKGEFSGAVELFGEDLAGKRPAELGGLVGLVFQDFESQLFSTNAELDVAFGPENLGLDPAELRERVGQALAAVGMTELRRRPPATLSGGQKQRLAIAGVLAMRPRLLCLDEPTTDLDPQGRDEIAALLARLRDQGQTIIIAEQQADLIESADRIVALEAGVKTFDGPAEQVLFDPPRLQRLGVRPPDLALALDAAGVKPALRTATEAAAAIKAAGVGLDPQAGPALDAADREAASRLGPELIRVEGLVHHYPNGVVALDGADLTVRRGELIAIVGKNGSGKTTLVKHLNGLLPIQEGAATLDGRDLRGMRAAELGRRIGFVFQDPDDQLFASTVFEEVAFAPRNFGFGEAEVKARVRAALELVGLVGALDQDPFVLTKGERQRVALASALAPEPEIVILDEPTTGLDYPAQLAVMDLLAELVRSGKTVIIITHALWVAAQYARRIVIMAGGRIVADAPARAALQDLAALKQAGLKPPPIMALGLALGAPLLSVDELKRFLVRGR